MSQLCDSYKRRLNYLRLSLTDRCNLRCSYCRPFETASDNEMAGPLTPREIENLARALGPLGICKIRLTGGEPTLRRDLLDIVATLNSAGHFEKIALSTNGVLLKDLAFGLKMAGINAINISVDTLDREKFANITGYDKLMDILHGIEVALTAGITSIKVNAVLMNGINDGDGINQFLQMVKVWPISVRFIELMKLGVNESSFAERYLSPLSIIERLELDGWVAQNHRLSTDGPAQIFRHHDFRGSVGFILPYSRKFCGECNRIRVDSRGRLRTCLFGKNDYSLRDLLQKEEMRSHLQDKILSLLDLKPKEHHLEMGDAGKVDGLVSIGG
ncbi:MAG TPA: GTP 3',8-cyclase MoaA [Bacteriovoracaceae bacterium]|nr:GTP 3',8-cyclase MoaA [Bacteriovoracaceae bacterium]